MKTLAIIPARAGSKGVPGKNKRMFCGKPLVAWAIEVGKRTCTRVCVTSDDPEVLEIAKGLGVQALLRPAELAKDDTPMLPVLQHALAKQWRHFDPVVLLQPTSPLRTDGQVKSALMMLAAGSDSVASVVPIPAHMAPDYAVRLVGGLLTVPKVTRRQDCAQAYYLDGTVYAMRTSILKQGDLYGLCLPLVLSESESCTIDTEADWDRAEQLWRARNDNR